MKPRELTIVFFGTPDFTIPILETLKRNNFIPRIIVTTPDRPQGRKMILTPPPVKVWGQENSIVVLQPEKLNEEVFLTTINDIKPDLFIVAFYGKIIPRSILDIPKYGALNVHPSLLPKLRGASPVRSLILLDSKETGVTIIQMDDKMDHGPIVAQEKIIINEWPTGSTLEHELAKKGGDLLARTILPYIDGEIELKEQNHDLATFTKKIQKEDGLINFNDDPYLNFRKIMAYDGWPRSYFFAQNKEGNEVRVVITEARFIDPILKIEKVIPEGKKEISFNDFIKSYSIL